VFRSCKHRCRFTDDQNQRNKDGSDIRVGSVALRSAPEFVRGRGHQLTRPVLWTAEYRRPPDRETAGHVCSSLYACDAQWSGPFDRMLVHLPEETERRVELAAAYGA
jgi:hypothetical protein